MACGGVALSAATLLSLLPTSAARAAVTGCQQNARSSQWLYADMGPGFECYVGDTLYRNFDLSSSGTAFAANDQFSLNQYSFYHILNVQKGDGGAFAFGNTYSFSYVVDVWTGTNKITQFSTGATTSIPGSSWTKTLAATPANNGPASVTNPAATSDSKTFSTPASSVTFTTTISVTGPSGGVTQFTDTLTQDGIDPLAE